MRTQSIVIIGITATLLAALAAVGWVVTSALKLADPPLWLSVFEPHAGGCAWYRMSVGGREEDEIARFAVDCPKVLE